MLTLSACGTTYQLAAVDDGTAQEAARMFAAAASEGARPATPASVAEARFRRVVQRVRPVAEALCRREVAEALRDTCAVPVAIDTGMSVPNAYFTYADRATKRRPRIMVTVPLLRDVRNDDELAFVIGHEYGHLIGQHIQKAEQQAMAGAFLMGVIAAAATQGAQNNQQIINDSMELGGAIGQRAFSQTYELESDTLGTLIARQAGYDPVLGARYFARPAEAKTVNGQLSFWGTHPPDERRLAMVMATAARIEAGGGIVRARPRDAPR
jgi:Zn-dependent protease with chaperone function